jgi:hypothetical protein
VKGNSPANGNIWSAPGVYTCSLLVRKGGENFDNDSASQIRRYIILKGLKSDICLNASSTKIL